MVLVLFFILACIMALIIFYTAMLVTAFTAAPFVPSIMPAVRTMLEEARIKPGEVVYDLGSGDGRLVRGAARMGARATGVERSRTLVMWSKLIGWYTRTPRHKFICGNFYKTDLRDADVVFTYLLPEVMERLRPKFENELRPGVRVVSYAFKVPGWTATSRIKFSPKSPAVYVYIVQ